MVRGAASDVRASNFGRKIIPPWRYNGNLLPDRYQTGYRSNVLDTSSGSELNRLSGLFPASPKTVYSEHHTVYQNFIQGFQNAG